MCAVKVDFLRYTSYMDGQKEVHIMDLLWKIWYTCMPGEIIRDNYTKYIATTDYLLQKRNGIKHINILECMKESKKF